MEILNQFGFDLKLFSAQIINFLIIVFVFKKFLYKPLLKLIDSREKKIAQGLIDADKARKLLEKSETDRDEILKKASLDANKILTEAKEQSSLMKEELLSQTKDEIAKMMTATKEQIALERENFKKESKNLSLEIAKSILENTINNMFDEKEGEKLIKKGLSKLKNVQ